MQMSEQETPDTFNGKRKRVDSSAADAMSIDNAKKKSTDFWFKDGNLTLEVEDTQYRVHRSVLSRHSSVFLDMLELPQAETTTDGAEDTQIPVCLYDAKKDWDNLLGIIYDPFRAFDGWQNHPIECIFSMLRLGHKYQFDQFEIIACKRMLGIFPTTFSEWESSTLFFRCAPVVKNKDVELLEHFAYDMLALIKETGPQCLLPTVYLFCLWSSSELVSIEHYMMTISGLGTWALTRHVCFQATIFNGRKRQDGTLATLSAVDQQTIILGREKIIEKTGSVLLELISDFIYLPASTTCQNPAHCSKVRADFYKHHVDLILGNSFQLAFFNPWINLPAESGCRQCASWLRKHFGKLRKNLWEALPGFFGLPPWKDLAKPFFDTIPSCS